MEKLSREKPKSNMFLIKRHTPIMKNKFIMNKYPNKKESEITTLLSMLLNINPSLSMKPSLNKSLRPDMNRSLNKKLNMLLKLKLNMFLNILLSILLKKESNMYPFKNKLKRLNINPFNVLSFVLLLKNKVKS